MTPEQMKAAVRVEVLKKDAFTSNGAYNTIQALDLLIDEFSAGGGGGADQDLDSVLAAGNDANAQAIENLEEVAFRSQDASGFFATLSAPNLTENRTITIPNADVTLGGGGGIDTVLAVGQAITEERVIELNGQTLKITNNGQNFFYINGQNNNEQIFIRSFNNDVNDGIIGGISMASQSDQGYAEIFAAFNEGVTDDTRIVLKRTATERTIEYAADTHTFIVGDIIISALAGGGTTGLSIDDTGKIIRTP